MTVFPTDYYAAAAQLIPLLFVILIVEARVFAPFDENLTKIENALAALQDVYVQLQVTELLADSAEKDAEMRRVKETSADLWLKHRATTWTFLAILIGVLESLVLGEVIALRSLARRSTTDAQDGLVISALITGGTLLVWFPLKLPLRHMRVGTKGFTKAAESVGTAILMVMLCVAAFGPLVYALVVLGGAV